MRTFTCLPLLGRHGFLSFAAPKQIFHYDKATVTLRIGGVDMTKDLVVLDYSSK